jgi:hypothetical protein
MGKFYTFSLKQNEGKFLDENPSAFSLIFHEKMLCFSPLKYMKKRLDE